MSLEDLRRQIDAIDTDIIRLLNERADIVHEIGAIKKRDGLEIYAPEREEALLRSLVAKGEGGRLPAHSIRAIYREIMSAALALEEDLKIAYLGPAGTWTHQAAIRKFGHSVKYLPQPGFADVFEQVARRVADYGVVPIENSTEGAVRDMFRLFSEYSLKICANVPLPIEICLMSRGSLEEIQRVYGHPSNLAATRRWLAAHLPNVEVIEVASSSQAAAKAMGDPRAAAVGTHVAAETSNLRTLATRIEDERSVARFSVVGRLPSPPTGSDLTLLAISGSEIGGTVTDILRLLLSHGVEAVRIDAHETAAEAPPDSAGSQAVVRLEVAGHAELPPLSEAITALRNEGKAVTIFGSYPRPTCVDDDAR